MQLQKENKIMITIEIDQEFHQELENEATRRKISLPAMLHKVLSEYFIPSTPDYSDFID